MADVTLLGRPSDLPYTSRSRAERLVATGRLVLVAFTLLVLSLDPSEPARYARLAYGLMLGYLGYAALLASLAFFWRAPHPRLGLAAHAADLALFSVFLYLTDVVTSPFFIFFTFSLVVGTVRWQWRGALWTAVAALAVIDGLTFSSSHGFTDPAFALNRFLIRNFYFAATATLLGYLGLFESRLRRELARLAAWPRLMPQDLDRLLLEVMDSAAAILAVPRLLVVWDDPDEPWLRLALWYQGKLGTWREPPESYRPVVADEIADVPFLSPDCGARQPVVWRAARPESGGWQGAPLNAGLQARFGITSVACVPIRSAYLSGHLFALDRRRMTVDDLVLGEVVAGQLTASLDHFYLSRQLRKAAAGEERVRLARDLHDGVLQSLTGAALQLQTAERLMAKEPHAARTLLGEIQRMIADEQRDLRFFIHELKPGPIGALDDGGGLEPALRSLARRLESVWDLRVELPPHVPDLAAPDAVLGEVYRIVQEAAVNAARHGKASQVEVGLGRTGRMLSVTVTDNGAGFPFIGHYDHDTLIAMRRGPRTLRERVTALGGTIDIESSRAGSRVACSIPVPHDGA
jgi:signal transduction histidine kinase